MKRGGLIADTVRKIKGLVRITPGYEWVAWSAALMAVEGPLSMAQLVACIEGSQGHGGKFTNALKRQLATCDVELLDRHTLRKRDGTLQLHRFDYLRPRLAEHGIQLPDEATGLVRTKTRRRA